MQLPKAHWKFILDFHMLSILMLIAVIPCLLGTWWLFSSYQDYSLEAQGANLAEAADMAFTYLNTYLGNQIIEITGITEVPVLRDTIEKKNLDLNRDLTKVHNEIVDIASRWRSLDYKSPELRAVLDNPASEYLRRYASVRPSYREIIVTDFLGRTVAATGKTTDYHHANDAWWNEAYAGGQKGAIYVGDIHYNDGSKIYSFDMAVPFVDDKGGVMGVIMVGIDAQEIHSLIGSLRTSFGSTATLIRGDGRVISAPVYSYADRQTFPNAPEILSAKEKGKRHIISQSEPRTIYGVQSRNLQELYPHLNWILTISSPVGTVVKPLINLRRNVVLLILAVVAVTFLVTLLLSSVESKPVLEEDAHLEQL